jgi:hypothetical protein
LPNFCNLVPVPKQTLNFCMCCVLGMQWCSWLRPVRGGLLHFVIMVLKHDAQLYICYMAFCRLFDGGSYIFSAETAIGGRRRVPFNPEYRYWRWQLTTGG